ncbi:MAG: ATP-binding cassette domain-containing protein, partial [Oscillospiraceae bacterium]|nr:ATP-binding cassette domain-containing protein [Oscillospiraceae bacterium]
MLEIKELSKWFSDGKSKRYILSGINLSVSEHDFISIIGSSGAGKSTLLNLISGLETPDEGKIYLNGKNYSEYSDKQLAIMRRKQISVIYQFFNLISVLN